MTSGWNLRSLRVRAFLVVVAIVITPLLVVTLSGSFEQGLGELMLNQVVGGADATRTLLLRDEAPTESSIDAIATDYKVRVRVFDDEGNIVVDANREAKRDLWRTVSDIWYGKDGVPSLGSFDETLGPVLKRAEVEEARARGRAADCRTAAGGEVLVCHAVRWLEATRGGPARIVYVQDSTPRAIGALHDERRQLTILMITVLPMALVLGWWLGWRFVQPIEKIREQLLAKAAHAAPGADVDVGRDDEFGDLTTAFNALLSALQVRAKANEAFVADLAHEFKNPVAAIRACAEALDGSAGPVDATRAARLAGLLKDSSRRLDGLVTQFLELARAEAGMPNEPRAEVDLDRVVRGIVETLAADERYRGVRFEVEGGGARITAVGDRLESALRNVLDNAASFAAPAGVVTVSTRVEGGMATVRVSDTGPGIAPEDVPRVFDRFFTTRGSTRGTGLGLALVRAVVEGHGGTVHARSTPGEGATFELVLPVKPSSASMVGAARGAPRGLTRGAG